MMVVKQLLLDAETAIKEGDYATSMEKSTLSVYEIEWWVNTQFYDSSTANIVIIADYSVTTEMNDIRDLALSGPYSHKILKLKRSSGIVFLHIPVGTPVKQIMKEKEYTSEDAKYTLELTREFTLWAEQVYS